MSEPRLPTAAAVSIKIRTSVGLLGVQASNATTTCGMETAGLAGQVVMRLREAEKA